MKGAAPRGPGLRPSLGITLSAAAVLGGAAVALARLGNPPNMGICTACFLRDTAGGLGLFPGPAGIRYLRPEIPGLLLGATAAAFFFREFRARSGGGGAWVRFFLGACFMVGALVFLGCPIRLAERIASGDWTSGAWGLLGLGTGGAAGALCLRRGFRVEGQGPSRSAFPAAGYAAPLLGLALLVWLVWEAAVSAPPAAAHAPVAWALGLAFAAGFGVQRARLCTVGWMRDSLLHGDHRLLVSYGTLLLVLFTGAVLVDRLIPGPAPLFRPGAVRLAHGEHLWNFLGMFLAGLSGVLMGGCPLRQLAAAGEGNGAAGFALLGLLAGAVLCHHLGLAARPAVHASPGGPATAGQAAVLAGIVLCLALGLLRRTPAPSREGDR